MNKSLYFGCMGVLVGAVAVNWIDSTDQIPNATAQATQVAQETPLPQSQQQLAPSAADLPAELTPAERIHIAVYEAANRAVVNIDTLSVRRDMFGFFDVPSEGTGSGSILDRDGHILTNFHVVKGAGQIDVTLANGNTYPARMIGGDAESDVAVLAIDAPEAELHPVILGESAPLRVGQIVYAIGNPFGLARTLTTGIISSLNRSLRSLRERRVMKSIIQVDAAMNPGNSGGPLLDTSARMIGMNTAIASRTGQNTGVGFAIPVDRIKRIVPQLIASGKVTRPDIGITQVVPTDQGLQIASVSTNGPAEQAGLRGFQIVQETSRRGGVTFTTRRIDRSAADVIVAVDGNPVRTFDDLLSHIEEKQPGDDVILTIIRKGREQRTIVRLGSA